MLEDQMPVKDVSIQLKQVRAEVDSALEKGSQSVTKEKYDELLEASIYCLEVARGKNITLYPCRQSNIALTISYEVYDEIAKAGRLSALETEHCMFDPISLVYGMSHAKEFKRSKSKILNKVNECDHLLSLKHSSMPKLSDLINTIDGNQEIRSINYGLTCIVGPPNSGKTYLSNKMEIMYNSRELKQENKDVSIKYVTTLEPGLDLEKYYTVSPESAIEETLEYLLSGEENTMYIVDSARWMISTGKEYGLAKGAVSAAYPLLLTQISNAMLRRGRGGILLVTGSSPDESHMAQLVDFVEGSTNGYFLPNVDGNTLMYTIRGENRKLISVKLTSSNEILMSARKRHKILQNRVSATEEYESRDSDVLPFEEV